MQDYYKRVKIDCFPCPPSGKDLRGGNMLSFRDMVNDLWLLSDVEKLIGRTVHSPCDIGLFIIKAVDMDYKGFWVEKIDDVIAGDVRKTHNIPMLLHTVILINN